MTAKLVEDDLLDFDAKYIVHQTNCISKGSSGIAGALFYKYPWADVYKERAKGNYWHIPGHIYIRENNGKNIINAMGQFSPGLPGENLIIETAVMRKEWFLECLSRIMLIKDLTSIAFPYKIGCGLAGGNWDLYRKIIDKFSIQVDVDVFIVKRPEDT